MELFCNEQRRQAMVYERKVEKVFWTIENDFENDPVKVLMNRNISTFRDCMKHISRLKADHMALAYANGSYKSVFEKLSGNGKMTPLDYNCQDKHHADAVNMAYWRTCAFLLGAVIDEAFAVDVQLVGPSKVDYHSGRFEYIARIENLPNWTPNSASIKFPDFSFFEDLFALTEKAVEKYITRTLTIEPLLVSLEFALDLFDSNVWKQELVHEMKHEAENGEEGVNIYRMGDFVDITYGPLIPYTSHIDKFALTKVEHENFEYRFIGVSVPKALKCSSYSWDLICNASVMPPVKERKLLEASSV
uniref:tRNA_SAD domain-containing protein n=1 Tax=Onchocerca volvulus TaxID=6282 RepID=A0A8R1TZX6_ONCVO